MNDDLDTLLSQPLAEMPDHGFSSRVMARLEAETQIRALRRERFATEIATGVVLFAMLVLPFTPLGAALAASAMTIEGMAVMGVALAAATLFAARTASR